MKTDYQKMKALYEAPSMESTLIFADSCILSSSPYQSCCSTIEKMDFDDDEIDW